MGNNLVSYISGEIKVRDLIIVSHSFGFDIGFYVGQGSGGSCQYYSINDLAYRHDLNNGRTQKRKLYVSYIYNRGDKRIARYDKSLITDHRTIVTYNKAIMYLESMGMIADHREFIIEEQ